MYKLGWGPRNTLCTWSHQHSFFHSFPTLCVDRRLQLKGCRQNWKVCCVEDSVLRTMRAKEYHCARSWNKTRKATNAKNYPKKGAPLSRFPPCGYNGIHVNRYMILTCVVIHWNCSRPARGSQGPLPGKAEVKGWREHWCWLTLALTLGNNQPITMDIDSTWPAENIG